jgi:hypothetical protein
MKSKTLLPRPCPDRLFFTPLVWLKLQWFCHTGHTEIGGFGISAEHNPLYVEDFVVVKQYVSPVTVRFDDEAVAGLFDELVDRGLQPHRFGRIWIHTHPGESPLPSPTDEETFARCFGGCDWALMFILSRTEQTYARLSFSAGPGGSVLLPTAVHWDDWPRTLEQGPSLGARIGEWQHEYDTNVHPVPELQALSLDLQDPGPGWWDREPWSEELDGAVYKPITHGVPNEFPF